MKNYTEVTITAIREEADQTYIIRLDASLPFIAGQWVFIKNPQGSLPDEAHPFSLASSPHTSGLELCIKVLGDWTSEIPHLTVGNTLQLSEPQGEFTWDESASPAVFLVGGVGISPLISILRDLAYQKSRTPITMLYGSRTEATIVYKEELERVAGELLLTVHYVLSHLSPDDPWTGYRGFFTKDILHETVDFSHKPIFYVAGPPIFITKMLELLTSLSVPKDDIRYELLEIKNDYL